jgi:two-component system response regulator FixJ
MTHRNFLIQQALDFVRIKAVMGAFASVYVVDDDPAMLESTQFLLESLDIRTRTFADPLIFLREVRALEPGYVLTDLSMPSMTGIELYAALRAKSVDWPVILMSGHSDAHALGPSLGGIAAFLEKPFTVPRLLDVLESAAQGLA